MLNTFTSKFPFLYLLIVFWFMLNFRNSILAKRILFVIWLHTSLSLPQIYIFPQVFICLCNQWHFSSMKKILYLLLLASGLDIELNTSIKRIWELQTDPQTKFSLLPVFVDKFYWSTNLFIYVLSAATFEMWVSCKRLYGLESLKFVLSCPLQKKSLSTLF